MTVRNVTTIKIRVLLREYYPTPFKGDRHLQLDGRPREFRSIKFNKLHSVYQSKPRLTKIRPRCRKYLTTTTSLQNINQLHFHLIPARWIHFFP